MIEQYYDDVVSLGAKYDVVNANNLAGVGFFTLDYGGGAPELWHLIDNKFATTTPWYSVGGVLASSPAVTSWGLNRTDVFGRGTDNALWHRFWNGTAWSAWESLGGVLTASPGAVSWGPNHLDVFVRGTDHAVWHRSWDGTSWATWDSVGGIATTAPEAASWGPGRLDVVVGGTDNALWHRSWNGTAGRSRDLGSERGGVRVGPDRRLRPRQRQRPLAPFRGWRGHLEGVGVVGWSPGGRPGRRVLCPRAPRRLRARDRPRALAEEPQRHALERLDLASRLLDWKSRRGLPARRRGQRHAGGAGARPGPLEHEHARHLK
ncbi:MAG: hypothetical protein E6I60_16785 [Chloroflexi bacterium]|nr:MAG: hypothetical protein E6I60_16785 [Chloroflexota bacterium]